MRSARPNVKPDPRSRAGGLLAALFASAVAVAGCAFDAGWEVSSRPSCPIPDDRVVCVQASPDLGGTFEVGGVRALPGECVRSPEGSALVRVQVERDGAVRRRTVRAPSAAVTEVMLVDGRTFKRQYARCVRGSQ